MKRKLLFLTFLISYTTISSQIQIGNSINGESEYELSGWSIATSSDGTTIIIGSPLNGNNGEDSGHIRVYKNVNNTWQQVGNSIEGENIGDQSGYSVAISSDGSVIAIGSPYNDNNGENTGQVKVYRGYNNKWYQVGDAIEGSYLNGLFGRSISLSANGNIVAVSTPNDSSKRGSVKTYLLQATGWSQFGQEIVGEYTGDLAGIGISLNNAGNIVAVGSPKYQSSKGYVRIYQFDGSQWIKIGQNIKGENTGDQFGSTIDLSKDGYTLIAGGTSNNGNGILSGHARVYEYSNGSWTQKGNDIDGEATQDRFGWSVAISDNSNVIAIGGKYNSENYNNAGHIRAFQFLNNDWTQIGNDIDGIAEGDNFGQSIALSSDGKTLIGGAPKNDNNGNDSGHVRVFDISNVVLSNESIDLVDTINIYPNPTSKSISISLKNNTTLVQVKLYNNLGQLVLKSKETTIDVSNHSKGIYFLEVETSKGKGVKKLVIK
jgi:ribosomal protein S6E (S10)